MQEELVSFDTAKLAKEKGFDEECMNYFEWYIYNGKEHGPTAMCKPLIDFRKWPVKLEDTQKRPMMFNRVFWPQKNSQLQPWLYARPTQDLLERWLRERHYLDMQLTANTSPEGKFYMYRLVSVSISCVEEWLTKESFASHELAREAALQHSLTLIASI